MSMTLKQAKEITGHKSGLGKPSKMPGFSTSLSAYDCKVGRKLAKIEGSVCHSCYATRGNYAYDVVKNAHKARKAALSDPQWVDAMTLLIGHYTDKSDPYFRIHDSGDIQDYDHLMKWIQIARNLPWVNFWMPSKEYVLVKRAKRLVTDWPSNLVVRLSSPMIGQKPPKSISYLSTSTVSADEGEKCEAYTRGGVCGPCRSCWDETVSNVDYPKH